MKPSIFWIEQPCAGRLGIMARPRGGDWLEDEIISLKETGIDVIVSLLRDEEVAELALQLESEMCESNRIEFITFPIIDRDVPGLNTDTFDFIKRLNEKLSNSLSIVIHCRMGIGRSSLIAASILALGGTKVDEAFRLIEVSRKCSVPDTKEQREWVDRFSSRFIS